MRLRKLTRVAAALGLVAGVAVAVGVTAAGPAAGDNTITFTSPADGATITELPMTIAGSAHLDGGCITHITLSVTGPQDATPDPNEINGSGGPDQGFSWPHPALLANGDYHVTADVTYQGICGADFTTASFQGIRNFKVNAPPAEPTGLKVGSTGQRTVPLAWDKNDEVDLQGYRVYRIAQKTGCKAPGATDPGWDVGKDATSYTDSSLPVSGGTYCYYVRAWRKDADGKPALSDPSTAATATVPAAGSNPTTGGSSGSGGGSDSNFTATAGDPTTAGQPDVNGFGAGLDRNRRDAPTLAPAQGGKAPTQRDTGFKETLPFGTATGQGGQGDKEDGADDPNAEQAAAPNGDRGDSAMSIHASNGNGNRVKTLGTFAGGLIATVILGHLLVLRREVNKDGRTAPLDVEATPPTA